MCTCFPEFATGKMHVMKEEVIQSIIKLLTQVALGVDFGNAVLAPGIYIIEKVLHIFTHPRRVEGRKT